MDISSSQNTSWLSCSRLQLLHPSILGIRPEPPDWPGRSEIIGISIEQRANRVEIPLSIKIIKMKQRHIITRLKPIDEAVESTNCSMRRVFSSSMLIFWELQMYAVHMMMERSLGGEELKEIVGKVQREINASFVCLFMKVFSQMPTLMVYLMILLANFSVYSMVSNSTTTAPMILPSETIREDENQGKNHGFMQREESPVFSSENEQLGLSSGEALWTGIMEEIGKIRCKVLDEETVRGFVEPVTVRADREENEEHLSTNTLYQLNLSRDPKNPLLQCNYAQFLTHISHDHDRAEEYFKRAMHFGQPDAEALSHYADFLYMVRRDMWAAEKRYQQAIAMEPNNPFYDSKYVSSLWSTGGVETCFPLELPDDSFQTKRLSSIDKCL